MSGKSSVPRIKVLRSPEFSKVHVKRTTDVDTEKGMEELYEEEDVDIGGLDFQSDPDHPSKKFEGKWFGKSDPDHPSKEFEGEWFGASDPVHFSREFEEEEDEPIGVFIKTFYRKKYHKIFIDGIIKNLPADTFKIFTHDNDIKSIRNQLSHLLKTSENRSLKDINKKYDEFKDFIHQLVSDKNPTKGARVKNDLGNNAIDFIEVAVIAFAIEFNKYLEMEKHNENIIQKQKSSEHEKKIKKAVKYSGLLNLDIKYITVFRNVLTYYLSLLEDDYEKGVKIASIINDNAYKMFYLIYRQMKKIKPTDKEKFVSNDLTLILSEIADGRISKKKTYLKKKTFLKTKHYPEFQSPKLPFYSGKTTSGFESLQQPVTGKSIVTVGEWISYTYSKDGSEIGGRLKTVEILDNMTLKDNGDHYYLIYKDVYESIPSHIFKFTIENGKLVGVSGKRISDEFSSDLDGLTVLKLDKINTQIYSLVNDGFLVYYNANDIFKYFKENYGRNLEIRDELESAKIKFYSKIDYPQSQSRDPGYYSESLGSESLKLSQRSPLKIKKVTLSEWEDFTKKIKKTKYLSQLEHLGGDIRKWKNGVHYILIYKNKNIKHPNYVFKFTMDNGKIAKLSGKKLNLESGINIPGFVEDNLTKVPYIKISPQFQKIKEENYQFYMKVDDLFQIFEDQQIETIDKFETGHNYEEENMESYSEYSSGSESSDIDNVETGHGFGGYNSSEDDEY